MLAALYPRCIRFLLLLPWFHEHTPSWFFVFFSQSIWQILGCHGRLSLSLRYAALGTDETKPDVIDEIQGSHPIETVFIML